MYSRLFCIYFICLLIYYWWMHSLSVYCRRHIHNYTCDEFEMFLKSICKYEKWCLDVVAFTAHAFHCKMIDAICVATYSAQRTQSMWVKRSTKLINILLLLTDWAAPPAQLDPDAGYFILRVKFDNIKLGAESTVNCVCSIHCQHIFFLNRSPYSALLIFYKSFFWCKKNKNFSMKSQDDIMWICE